MKSKMKWHQWGACIMVVGMLICLISGIAMVRPGKKQD